MSQLPFDFSGAGRGRADGGMDQTLEAEGPSWQEATTANVVAFLRTHQEYTPDDLHRYGLMAWEPHHRNCIGALHRDLIRHGYLEFSGTMQSERDGAQARRIPIYRSAIWRKPS